MNLVSISLQSKDLLLMCCTNADRYSSDKKESAMLIKINDTPVLSQPVCPGNNISQNRFKN